MLFIDNREAELIKRLTVEHTVQQLPVGDIWIRSDVKDVIKETEVIEVIEEEKKETDKIRSGGLVIERKSIRDLEASILDGRYREQRGRILSYCHEHHAQPLYLLEGSLSSGTGRLQKKAILKFIHRLTLHYQIPILQTASVQETAELIEILLEQWTEDPTSLQRTTELIKVSDGIHVQKKANSQSQFTISCLAQCPGVSVKMAEAILTAFSTFPAIMEATAKEIEVIKVGSRKVGPVVSQRLFGLLHS